MRMTIDITKEPGLTGDLWVSHCLELDIISQAIKPEIAIEAVAEAVRAVLQHEMKRRGLSCTEAFGAIAADVAARRLKEAQEDNEQIAAPPAFSGTVEEFENFIGIDSKERP